MAVEAYQSFHDGSAKKYVIDPHNTTKLASSSRTGERISAGASA
jgi:glutathione-independent formaldehyde dehydrogenase